MTIQETQTPETGKPAGATKKPKLNRKRWWLIGGAIVLIAVIVCVVQFNSGPKSEKERLEFMDKHLRALVESANAPGKKKIEADDLYSFSDNCRWRPPERFQWNPGPLDCSVNQLDSPESKRYTAHIDYGAYAWVSGQEKLEVQVVDLLCAALKGGYDLKGGEEYQISIEDKAGKEVLNSSCGQEDIKKILD